LLKRAKSNQFNAYNVQLKNENVPKRNSPNDIKKLEDLNRLNDIVKDKRNSKRADAKKNRRNRHYGKQFIKNTITKLNTQSTLEDADII
jgi:hypothetical protein